ncbi:hypothetical protein [Actinokineospora enzanensis]|uniref:hypothetical protein n=1 Tax=Actinokineospora enzanensis TaxID=155975 RepID=UPI00037D77D3|nr:hypothetical protein [Actinokineospora enzanensis]
MRRLNLEGRRFEEDKNERLIGLRDRQVVVAATLGGMHTRIDHAELNARGFRQCVQKAKIGRLLPRALMLLLITNLTALVLVMSGNLAHGPDAMRQTLIVVGGTGVAGLLVLAMFRLWDRWFPPGVHVEPVTVERVREVTVHAERTLQRVRADNQRVARMAAQVEQRLQTVRVMDFIALRDLHHESVGCADGAYRHYRSAGLSLDSMSGMLVRVRANLALRRPTRGGNRGTLSAAAANLAQTKQSLGVEVKRGRAMVHTLNANTAQLKHSIRDNCGKRGQRWYAELEQRTEARKAQSDSARSGS